MGRSRFRPLHTFALAVQLLTRLPVRVRGFDEDDLPKAVWAFPLVGVLVAGAGIATRLALAPLLGGAAATVLAVAAMVLVTGAFHEDGLADSADGLWGGWTPERRVEIMRDSRIGTYGAAALVLSLLFRVALLAPLTASAFATTVLAGAVLGRAAGVLAAGSLPPVSDQGLGAKVIGPQGAWTWVAVAASSALAAVLAAGVWGWCLLLVALLAVALVRRVAQVKVGGMTGDLLGATNQVADLAVSAAAVALARHDLG